MRVTQQKRDYIREQAEASGLSVSEYVRRRVLSRRVVSRTDKKMLSELRRQGGLLKYVFKESRGMYSEKTATAIENMNMLIEGLESVVLNDSENSPGRRDRKSSFKDLTNYCLGLTGHSKGAVLHVGMKNLNSPPEKAYLEMEGLSYENVRCKNPAFLFILSWRAEESPPEVGRRKP